MGDSDRHFQARYFKLVSWSSKQLMCSRVPTFQVENAHSPRNHRWLSQTVTLMIQVFSPSSDSAASGRVICWSWMHGNIPNRSDWNKTTFWYLWKWYSINLLLSSCWWNLGETYEHVLIERVYANMKRDVKELFCIFLCDPILLCLELMSAVLISKETSWTSTLTTFNCTVNITFHERTSYVDLQPPIV